MVFKQFEVWLVNLDPTKGTEIQKTRPCVIVSPDEMNKFLNTVIIAPLTSKQRDYPSRVDDHFHDNPGQIVLDQLRAVDKQRLSKRLGVIDKSSSSNIIKVLRTMFSHN